MFCINRPQADPTGWIGAGIMIVFAAVAGYRWQATGLLFFALTMFRDVVAAGYLLTRRPPVGAQVARANGRGIALLAYVSSLIPLFYFGPVEDVSQGLQLASDFLIIGGYALSTLALLELGRSFGVSPANRGRVASGVYRLMSHPMYIGYALAELGLVFLNPWNWFLYVSASALYVARALFEFRILRLPSKKIARPSSGILGQADARQ